MIWSKRIELTFRGYARVHRAVEDTFNDVLGKFVDEATMTWGEHNVELSDVRTHNVPIADTKVEAAKKAGMLVMERGGDLDGWIVVIREWIVTVKINRAYTMDGRVLVAAILEKTGDVFTNIKIVTEAFTDVGPR